MFKSNREDREERNKVQMGKGHTAAWASSKGKQKITLTKSLMQMCFVSCASVVRIKGFKVLHLTFSRSTEPLPLFAYCFPGRPKGKPLISVEFRRPQDPTTHELLY